MALFPDDMPEVEPNWDDRAFWQYCNEQQLRFQACADCGVSRHPPTPICAACNSIRSTWIQAPAEGTVFTFTVIHHASHPAVAGNLPYVVADVEFDGLPGVRLVTNIVGVDPTVVVIGMRVRLTWDKLSDGTSLPRFTLVGAAQRA